MTTEAEWSDEARELTKNEEAWKAYQDFLEKNYWYYHHMYGGQYITRALYHAFMEGRVSKTCQ